MFARELKLDVLGVVVELMFNPCKLGIAKALGLDSVNPPNFGILKAPGSALSPANPPKLGIVNVLVLLSFSPPRLGIVKGSVLVLFAANPPKLKDLEAALFELAFANPPKDEMVKDPDLDLLSANPPRLGMVKVVGLLPPNPPKLGIVNLLGFESCFANPPKLEFTGVGAEERPPKLGNVLEFDDPPNVGIVNVLGFELADFMFGTSWSFFSSFLDTLVDINGLLEALLVDERFGTVKELVLVVNNESFFVRALVFGVLLLIFSLFSSDGSFGVELLTERFVVFDFGANMPLKPLSLGLDFSFSCFSGSCEDT